MINNLRVKTIYAFTACLVLTILISLVTKPREENELTGLVYSLTERLKSDHLAWYERPATLGAVVLVMALTLSILFW